MTAATDRPHGVSFIQVRHDPWCRVPDTQREAARAARRGRKS